MPDISNYPPDMVERAMRDAIEQAAKRCDSYAATGLRLYRADPDHPHAPYHHAQELAAKSLAKELREMPVDVDYARIVSAADVEAESMSFLPLPQWLWWFLGGALGALVITVLSGW